VRGSDEPGLARLRVHPANAAAFNIEGTVESAAAIGRRPPAGLHGRQQR